ncbi:MAG: cysteine--tRNA ligase, partial [Betaproteobacteria bacterium]|nr:cysteine--tRNA ligase [Betaproteobacteria bacterium]
RLYTALATVPPAPLADIDWQQPHAKRFQAAMNEDFGTSEAVAVLFDLASEVNRHASPELSAVLKALGGVLGLLQQPPQAFLQTGVSMSESDIQAQIQARAQAKKDRDFASADRIRQALADQGVVLKDSALGTTWERA